MNAGAVEKFRTFPVAKLAKRFRDANRRLCRLAGGPDARKIAFSIKLGSKRWRLSELIPAAKAHIRRHKENQAHRIDCPEIDFRGDRFPHFANPSQLPIEAEKVGVCHCEERSDEAIRVFRLDKRDCFTPPASHGGAGAWLAMASIFFYSYPSKARSAKVRRSD
jgi:hypothetical protein